jgi:allantoicase
LVVTVDRHIHTSQAFIPMSKGVVGGTEPLVSGGAYLSVVALNGKDDKPDVSTMRAFLGTVGQGVSYDEGIWRK